jgi:hypothetical protein
LRILLNLTFPTSYLMGWKTSSNLSEPLRRPKLSSPCKQQTLTISSLRLLIPSFPTKLLQQPIRREPWTGLSSAHSEGSLIAFVPGSLVAGDFGGEDADVFDAAVALGVVHAVADDELVGDLEGYVVGFDGDEATLGFVEAGGDF